MNIIGSGGSPVTPDVWEQQEMRDALLNRDVSTVYRLLRRYGVSQRQIAAYTRLIGGPGSERCST